MHCPLYVGPLTSVSAADVVRSKKLRGVVVFGETTPAALAVDGGEYWNRCWRHAASFVCSPPLRKETADAMVDLAVDSLDAVASDHCTFNAKQRALGKDDFREGAIRQFREKLDLCFL